MPDRFFSFEQQAGDPMMVSNYRIIPFAQSLRVRFPRWPLGGLIWNRPASVLVVSPDGQEQTLPIHDVTRQVQFSLLGAGLVSVILMSVIFRILDRK